MTGPFKTAAGFLAAALLAACVGCSADSPGDTTGYAPYVSASTAHATDGAGDPSAYNLAFVVADGDSCTPSWGGHTAIGDAAVKSRIQKLSSAEGATVRVSFGGATGNELATTCGSATALAAAYGKALDAAGDATHADFDIEGDTLKDSASVALRAKAIALLQRQRDLDVTFTLPVMPSGLDADGLALLDSANDHGVDVSTVNVMTMNYGETYTGDMGTYALRAARATHTQLRKVFGLSDKAAWRGMALTSMLGVNDIAGETFTLSDAAQVREFAASKGIGWVSLWATFRDVQCASGGSKGTAKDTAKDAATDCSGVEQSAGAFAEALAGSA
jgi:chitinase